jgi:hypothetical protein
VIVQGFVPRGGQSEVMAATERFLSVDAGRRWGKSIMGLNWCLEGIFNHGGPVAWISPIWAQAKSAYLRLLQAARKGGGAALIKAKSDTELRIVFVNGELLEFKSGEKPDNLRGEGWRRVVIDEAARCRKELWEEVVRPAVSDTGGRVMFLSTPKGKNWFYEMWSRGADPAFPAFRSWRFPTADNPKVPAEDIEQARLALPADVFAQEYLAEFLENNAGVFRGVRDAIGSEEEDPREGGEYYAGLDLARLTDFTVLTILDGEGRQVYHDRFNTLDWAVQKQRIISTIERYDARLLIDSTGIGDPIYDDLARAGLVCEGYKFDNQSKKRLIEALMMGFEQRRIRLLDIAEQTNELEIFEYEIGKSGIVRYSAPEGYHDDCVIALALAYWHLRPGRVEPRIYL